MTKKKEIMELPVWKEKYQMMGVTPQELYLRQNGLCWLKHTVDSEGKVELLCTDGADEAKTANMLNPTIECVRCMAGFAGKVIETSVKTES